MTTATSSRTVLVIAAAALVFLGGTATVIATNIPRGLRNNNPGNILKTPASNWSNRWQGEVESTDPRFARFATMADGVRALGKLLLNYQKLHKLNTVRAIVNRWAPPVENNTDAYVASVARALGVGPDQPIAVAAYLDKLVRAIATHENGAIAVAAHLPGDALTEGVRRALA